MEHISTFPHKIECAIFCCRYKEDYDEYGFPARMDLTVIEFCDKYFSIRDFNPDKLLICQNLSDTQLKSKTNKFKKPISIKNVEARKILRLLKSSEESKGSLKLLKNLIGSDKEICYDLLKIWRTEEGEIFFKSKNSKYYYETVEHGFKIIKCKKHDICDHKLYNSFITLAAMRKEQFEIMDNI